MNKNKLSGITKFFIRSIVTRRTRKMFLSRVLLEIKVNNDEKLNIKIINSLQKYDWKNKGFPKFKANYGVAYLNDKEVSKDIFIGKVENPSSLEDIQKQLSRLSENKMYLNYFVGINNANYLKINLLSHDLFNKKSLLLNIGSTKENGFTTLEIIFDELYYGTSYYVSKLANYLKKELE